LARQPSSVQYRLGIRTQNLAFKKKKPTSLRFA
jgi:hypothetical protein